MNKRFRESGLYLNVRDSPHPACGEGPGGDGADSGREVTLQGLGRGDRWRSVSDRKVREGIAGYGLCKFGAAEGAVPSIMVPTNIDSVSRI